jgi:hypothetical protein
MLHWWIPSHSQIEDPFATARTIRAVGGDAIPKRAVISGAPEPYQPPESAAEAPAGLPTLVLPDPDSHAFFYQVRDPSSQHVPRQIRFGRIGGQISSGSTVVSPVAQATKSP